MPTKLCRILLFASTLLAAPFHLPHQALAADDAATKAEFEALLKEARALDAAASDLLQTRSALKDLLDLLLAEKEALKQKDKTLKEEEVSLETEIQQIDQEVARWNRYCGQKADPAEYQKYKAWCTETREPLQAKQNDYERRAANYNGRVAMHRQKLEALEAKRAAWSKRNEALEAKLTELMARDKAVTKRANDFLARVVAEYPNMPAEKMKQRCSKTVTLEASALCYYTFWENNH
ncbi:MAG: hypothetical protein WAP51_02080 [Candidatus Sungiibacteriota bacterium]